ncbi:MAG: DUF6065 family protein [Acetobacteraceae bacterium]
MASPRPDADAGATDQSACRLQCFAYTASPPRLVPARPSRDWMDAVRGRHAYRCLPMAIANVYGWEVLSPCSFEVTWTGGTGTDALTFRVLDSFAEFGDFAASNFGYGIATFHTGYIFRTSPGWHLLASGPMNDPKHGIAPLSGVIETDWLPYPFTMNWKLTRPGSAFFAKDEPFCLVYPVRLGALDGVVPEILSLDDDPELRRQNDAWRDSRTDFLARAREGDPGASKEAWQKFYFTGKGPDGASAPEVHIQKLRLAPPVDRRDGRRRKD